MIFENREQAGKLLAQELKDYKNNKDTLVIGLARGGIVVAAEIAKELNLPLDIMAPRKIGAPFNPELAIGAITEDGQAILDENLVNMLGVSTEYIEKEIEQEREEAKRRVQAYRSSRSALNLENKTVILVDDGIATGSTIKAAIKSVQSQQANTIIIAVPVALLSTIKELESLAYSVIYLASPVDLGAISRFFRNFTQTGDDQVVEIMNSF